MTTAATLDTNLTLNSTAFRQGMLQAAQTANASLKSIQIQATQTASVLSSLNRAAAAFGGFEVLKEGLGTLLNAQVQLQAIEYTLLSATGNAIAAGNAMAFLRDESDKLGLSLPDTAEGFARLSAAASASGVSMADQQALFDAFAKASSTLHLSTAQSGRALLALQEMFSRGTISARQLNQQLGQAIPGSAVRFQQAALEMTKGTELQGKSFEQLLKGGKLVTTEFLPALTIALQQSGQGWEQASQGLNANLNRLRTAWFNLKTELSGGLFSDTASAGAALLADNLNKVAAALQLVAGVAIARSLGGLAQRGAGAAQFQVQNFVGTQQAAAAEREYAEAEVLAAKAAVAEGQAEFDRSAIVLESIKDVKLQAAAIRDNTLAVREATIARDEAAANVVAGSSNKFIPGQTAQGVEALAAAELNLAKAQRVQAVAAAGAATLREQETVATNELIAAELRLTAAEDALAAAQARVAETAALQASVGGLGAAIGRAATSFGQFALSLVGGPWGAAVLAVGGLVYEFESATSAAEHLQAQTKENAKAVEDLVKQAYDLDAAFKQIGNTDPLSKLKDSADTTSAALLDNVRALAKAQAALAAMKLTEDEANASAGHTLGILPGLQNEWNHLTGTYDATAQQVDELTAKQRELSAAVGTQEAAYVAAYGHNWDQVNATFQSMELSVSGLESAFQTLGVEMKKAFDLDAVVDKARAKLAEYQSNIEKEAEASSKKLRQKSMTPAQAAADDLAQAQAEALAGHTGGLDASALAAANLNIANLKGIEAAEAAKKAAEAAAAAAKAQARAAADLLTSQQGELAAAQAQLDQTDKMVPAQKQLNEELGGGVKAYNGMTEAQKAVSRATLEHAAALQEEFIEQEKVRKSTEAYLAMKENLDRVLENSRNELKDNLAAIGGQSAQASADDAALEQLRRNYTERQRLIDKNKELTIEAAAQATADNKAELDQQLADYRQFEQDRADALGNAMNGMKKAIADFIDAQNNQFAQAEKFTNDFLQQGNDALTNFETGTESAKKAFGDFIDSMYKEAWQFVNNQIFKALLLSFNAPGTQGQPGAGGSFWDNLKSGLSSGFASGTNATAAQAQAQAAAQAQSLALSTNTTTLASNTAALIELTTALSTQSATGSSGGGMGGGLMGLFGGGGGGGGFSVGGDGGAGTGIDGGGYWGGGMAKGGAVQAGRRYQVNETGAELLEMGGNDYLMMGTQSGTVHSAANVKNRMATGGVVNVTNINVQPTSTRRTADQIALANERRLRLASLRNG